MLRNLYAAQEKDFHLCYHYWKAEQLTMQMFLAKESFNYLKFDIYYTEFMFEFGYINDVRRQEKRFQQLKEELDAGVTAEYQRREAEKRANQQQ